MLLAAPTRSPLNKEALLERARKLEARIASDIKRLSANPRVQSRGHPNSWVRKHWAESFVFRNRSDSNWSRSDWWETVCHRRQYWSQSEWKSNRNWEAHPIRLRALKQPTSSRPTTPGTSKPTVRPTQEPTGKPTGTKAPSTTAPTKRTPLYPYPNQPPIY